MFYLALPNDARNDDLQIIFEARFVLVFMKQYFLITSRYSNFVYIQFCFGPSMFLHLRFLRIILHGKYNAEFNVIRFQLKKIYLNLEPKKQMIAKLHTINNTEAEMWYEIEIMIANTRHDLLQSTSSYPRILIKVALALSFHVYSYVYDLFDPLSGGASWRSCYFSGSCIAQSLGIATALLRRQPIIRGILLSSRLTSNYTDSFDNKESVSYILLRVYKNFLVATSHGILGAIPKKLAGEILFGNKQMQKKRI